MMRSLKLILLISLCMFILSSCKFKQPEAIDLSSIHTTAALKLTSPSDETTGALKETAKPSDPSKEVPSSSPGVSASLETYQNGQISIEYPVLSHMDNSDLQKTINEQLKSNALSVLKGYQANESADTLKIQCKVISVDRRRISVTYTGSYNAKGAAHPVNLFYTNTVDLSTRSDLGLSDFTDAATIAEYIRSADCQFYNVSSEIESQARSYIKEQEGNVYTAIFEHADFPLPTSEKKETGFPKSFSYEKQGVIYISVPVPHTLGDYVLIQFTPETK